MKLDMSKSQPLSLDLSKSEPIDGDGMMGKLWNWLTTPLASPQDVEGGVNSLATALKAANQRAGFQPLTGPSPTDVALHENDPLIQTIGGAGHGMANLASGMTSPANLGIIVASMVVPPLGEAIALSQTQDMLENAGSLGQSAYKDYQHGDYGHMGEHAIEGVASGAMPLLAAHGLGESFSNNVGAGKVLGGGGLGALMRSAQGSDYMWDPERLYATGTGTTEMHATPKGRDFINLLMSEQASPYSAERGANRLAAVKAQYEPLLEGKNISLQDVLPSLSDITKESASGDVGVSETAANKVKSEFEKKFPDQWTNPMTGETSDVMSAKNANKEKSMLFKAAGDKAFDTDENVAAKRVSQRMLGHQIQQHLEDITSGSDQVLRDINKRYHAYETMMRGPEEMSLETRKNDVGKNAFQWKGEKFRLKTGGLRGKAALGQGMYNIGHANVPFFKPVAPVFGQNKNNR